MVIAVDFDGTIVEHAYPKIGRPMPFAFDTLRQLQSDGHTIILWTYRAGKDLEDAVDYCKANGMEFYAVNQNYPGEIIDEKVSRKIYADVYIDDRNIGGFPGWGNIWKILSQQESANAWEFFQVIEPDNVSILDKLKRFFS
jgi:hydroxymethylpyrimidine pyrophosphatase-like HAD family hydrolase